MVHRTARRDNHGGQRVPGGSRKDGQHVAFAFMQDRTGGGHNAGAFRRFGKGLCLVQHQEHRLAARRRQAGDESIAPQRPIPTKLGGSNHTKSYTSLAADFRSQRFYVVGTHFGDRGFVDAIPRSTV